MLGGGLKIKLIQIVNTNSTKILHYNKVVIHNSTFSNNYADCGAGAGILIDVIVNPLKVLVSNSTFTQNIARHRCGGLIVETSDDIPGNSQSYFITIVGNTFFGNQAEKDATGLLIWPLLHNYSHFRILIKNCNFYSNTFIGDTKKRYIGHSALLLLRFSSFRGYNNSIIITNCFFVNNKGGSLYLSTDKQGLVGKLNVLINKCYFGHNSGGVYSTTTLLLNPICASVNISYCQFENNSALQNDVAVALSIMYFIENSHCSNLHLLNIT